jgi:hypothetical protein
MDFALVADYFSSGVANVRLKAHFGQPPAGFELVGEKNVCLRPTPWRCRSMLGVFFRVLHAPTSSACNVELRLTKRSRVCLALIASKPSVNEEEPRFRCDWSRRGAYSLRSKRARLADLIARRNEDSAALAFFSRKQRALYHGAVEHVVVTFAVARMGTVSAGHRADSVHLIRIAIGSGRLRGGLEKHSAHS